MSLPKNGRIAIVDDNIDQALPLMTLFGKLRVPYTYYDGGIDNLPEEGTENDIRILFLDINLDKRSESNDKILASRLIGTLRRLVSNTNYPYLLVYWSRDDTRYKTLVEDTIFGSGPLEDRAPTAFLSLTKSDFFELNDDKTENHNSQVDGLLEKISSALGAYPTMRKLLEWENLVHDSADNSLDELFRIKTDKGKWNEEAGHLFVSMGRGHSGKYYKTLSKKEQIQSTFHVLNSVHTDSLEAAIDSGDFAINHAEDSEDLTKPTPARYLVNRRLLFSKVGLKKFFPGLIYEIEDPDQDKLFKMVLNELVLRPVVTEKKKESICARIKAIFDKNPATIQQKAEKQAQDEEFSALKKEIEQTWTRVELVVTPLCDYVQQNDNLIRLVRGLLISSEYRQYFDGKSEAIFLSPSFEIDRPHNSNNPHNYFLALNFKYFTSIEKDKMGDRGKTFLRMRQQLLSEVQSKLSRHINRQGVLFLDDF